MKFIKGSGDERNECGGNYHHWKVVTKSDKEQHPDGVVMPSGSFHYAKCFIVREVKEGRTIDVRVRARAAQQCWDGAYDEYLIVPSLGGKIEIEHLDKWFNVWITYPARENTDLKRTVWRTMWKRALKHAGSAQELLAFIRGYISQHPKVLGLAEEDSLRVD